MTKEELEKEIEELEKEIKEKATINTGLFNFEVASKYFKLTKLKTELKKLNNK